MPVIFRFVGTLFGGEADVRTARETWMWRNAGNGHPEMQDFTKFHERSLGPQDMK
jgi:hypothetical protein